MINAIHNHHRSLRQLFAVLLSVALLWPTWLTASRVTASSTPTEEIGQSFGELQTMIYGLSAAILTSAQRSALSRGVSTAQKQFQLGDICASAASLEALFDDAQALRKGNGAAAAEDLFNSLWSLRQDVLALAPAGKGCDSAPRFNQPPLLKLGESDNKHLQGTVAFGEPKLWSVKGDGQLFTEMEIPGLQSGIGAAGKPSVPMWHRMLAVPQGAKVSARINVLKSRTLKLNLYPTQPEPIDAAQREQNRRPYQPEIFNDQPFTIDKEAYAQDTLYPHSVGTVKPAGQARELQLTQISIAAGQYNPAKDELTLFESVAFEVSFEGGKEGFAPKSFFGAFEPSATSILGSVINYEIVPNYLLDDLRIRFCVGEEYMILTHPDFRAAADALAVWKNSKGINTRVFNVNDGAGSGPDTKEEIDAFIESAYNRCLIRPSYVLLLGDAEYIPTFYRMTYRGDNAGTDYPYALLGDEAEDLAPDFALGRIPVDTLAQAQAVVDKTINYESHPPSNADFYENVGIASHFQCCRDTAQVGRDLRSFVETSELVRNELLTHSYNVDRIYKRTTEADYTRDNTPRRYYNGTLLPADIGAGSGFAWNGSTADIAAAWNAGRFLFLHRDHGYEYGWSNPRFEVEDVDDLTNGDLLPVVFSVNCASGLFDNETAPADAEYDLQNNQVYFVERLLRKTDGGAVGMIGDTRISPTWANSALTRGLFDAVWPNTVGDFGGGTSHRRLGDILNHAKLYLMTQVGVAGTTVAPSEDQVNTDLYIYHVFGDPTLKMWTSRPRRHLPFDFSVLLNPNSLKLKYAFDGAVITAWQETKEGAVALGRGTVKNGEVALPFVQLPRAGAKIQLTAEFDDTVSQKLTQ